MKLWIALVMIGVGLLWSSPLKVLNPEGDRKMTLYQKGQDSAVVKVIFTKPSLLFKPTMYIGQQEYKNEEQAFYLVVLPNTKQRIKVWNPEDPANYVELQIPSDLGSRQVIEFRLQEEVQVKANGKGRLLLDTRPSGASYELDGFGLTGTTPLDKELNALEYRILLQKDRYIAQDEIVLVERGQTINRLVQLKPNWADMTFVAMRPETWLEIDGLRYKIPEDRPLKLAGEKEGLLSGRHNYRYGAQGSREWEDFIMAEPSMSRTINLNAPLSYSVVQITTEPSGAQVTWDGKYRGKTPLKLPSEKLGSHTVQISHSLTAPYSQSMELSQYQERMAPTLELVAGHFQLQCPTGATVYVDGDARGECPFSDDLPLGVHQLEVQHPDYQAWQGSVNIAQATQQQSVPDLIAKPFILEVQSEPSGAEVWLDGKKIGVTPLRNYSLDGSARTAKVEVRKPEYDADPQSISIASNQQKSLRFSLSDGIVRIGNEVYKRVKIGNQIWLNRNLNVGVMVTDEQGQVNDSQVEKFCYDNKSENCQTDGGLYTWAEAMALPSSCNSNSCASKIKTVHQGICPTGWHIPSKADWQTLATVLGGSNVAGKKNETL